MRISKPPKVFYGWWVLGASFMVAFVVGGPLFYGFTALFEPIADEFGWSYAQISFATSLRGLESGLLAPVMGALADRWGPKRLIFSGGIIIALSLVLLSRTNSLAMFYGAFVVVAIGISTSASTVLAVAVGNWFHKKLGMASGILMAGAGAGGLLIPVMVRLIDAYGWRGTLNIIALGTLATSLPLSLLFRHKPEQYGYMPDGRTQDIETSEGELPAPEIAEPQITVKQALRSRVFWHMTVAFALHGVMITSVVIHIMPYLSSIGVARSTSSVVATAVLMVSIGGRLGFGWLGDKIGAKRVVVGCFALMGLGLLCFGFASSLGTWLLVPFLIIFGVSFGGVFALRPPLTRNLFGKRSFGTIFGFVVSLTLVGSITGPPLAGWVFDNWGTYHGVWYVLAGLAAGAVISMLTMPRVVTIAQPVHGT